jgi:hypothetical protein
MRHGSEPGYMYPGFSRYPFWNSVVALGFDPTAIIIVKTEYHLSKIVAPMSVFMHDPIWEAWMAEAMVK